MSAYPRTEHEQRISFDDLIGFVSGTFEGCGMRPEEARIVARHLAVADLRGVHSHGVLRVPEYAGKLQSGGVDPFGRPAVVRDSASALVIDGGNAMGPVAAHFAMERAIERAATAGVALAAARGSNHCGALFPYAMQGFDRGMIGLCATNALPTMAPWGGTDKVIGINPLAIGVPARDEAPLVLDAAFSYSSHGKIRVYHQKGAPIPSTWAFDREGKPTTSAEAAIEGLLQPIGEYKGVALAVLFGVLSSLLSGAAYGTELGNMVDGPTAGRDGHFFLAIRIGAFEEPDRFRARVDGVIRQIRESRKAEGVGALYAPGGLEASVEAEYRERGIPLNAATIEGLRLAAAMAGVAGELPVR
jgi:LDH2 family malate/lactate/ureidoglycolate dehydrogenase